MNPPMNPGLGFQVEWLIVKVYFKGSWDLVNNIIGVISPLSGVILIITPLITYLLSPMILQVSVL